MVAWDSSLQLTHPKLPFPLLLDLMELILFLPSYLWNGILLWGSAIYC